MPNKVNRFLADRDWLASRIDEGLTPKEIAERAGARTSGVNRWTLRHGLREPGKAYTKRERHWSR